MTYTVQVRQAEEQRIAAARERTRLGRVSSDIQRLLDAVWALLRERPELRRDGHNVAVYHTRDGETSVECGVQVVQPFDATATVVCSSIPGGAIATTMHVGSYAQLGAAHNAVIAWCGRNGHGLAGVCWEIYGDWEDDPAKLCTEVCYLLAA
jgi:effector-binding domain-containing protein